MKTGLTLEQLAAEITRQQSAKEDYVVNTGNLRLESYGPDLTLRVLDSDGADRIEPLGIGDIAHRQIGTHLSTADYLSLRYGAADWASCDSLENGVITLYNRLLSKIRADHDLLLEETDIDSILTGCSTEYGSEIQTLVERGAESFVADLFRTLRERKIELRTGKVIFVGGGSLLLRKQIEKSGKVGTAIFVEEIGANAAGYGLLYAATKTSR